MAFTGKQYNKEFKLEAVRMVVENCSNVSAG